ALRVRLGMEQYSKEVSEVYKLNCNDDWLRRRQGLALPVLPPTTPEARKYFFSQALHFAAMASTEGKTKINYEAFAREWNHSADGKDRFYITPEVLTSYAKIWEKANNIRASQELISSKLGVIRRTQDIFSASDFPFPTYLTDVPMPMTQPNPPISQPPLQHTPILPPWQPQPSGSRPRQVPPPAEPIFIYSPGPTPATMDTDLMLLDNETFSR
ncbi:hypothetical protein H0H87_000217, partial [Tephrocybe sp. NHM501043]